MPSFQDSAVIFFIALLLFGPKKLPELARYVGKLMNEFRRASNDFRIQMEDEFRQSEQTEQQKKTAAMEAAAPIPPTLAPSTYIDTEAPTPDENGVESVDEYLAEHTSDVPSTLAPEPTVTPLPIASNGDFHMMPPATGLPVGRSSSIGALFDSIPQANPPETAHAEHEAPTHG
jgi:sec-independent protein translocase protein TatB